MYRNDLKGKMQVSENRKEIPKNESEKAACVREPEWAFSIIFWRMQSGVDRGTKGENRDNPSKRQSAQSEQQRKNKGKGTTSPNNSIRADLHMINLSQTHMGNDKNSSRKRLRFHFSTLVCKSFSYRHWQMSFHFHYHIFIFGPKC